MRIVFAGTPEFAAAALAALIDAAPAHGFEIPLVLSQPDRPAGRGMKLVASPVKQLAAAHGLRVATPSTLNLKKGGAEAAAAHTLLRSVDADVLVVAAYGLILPQEVLDIPRGLASPAGPIRAINIHASLLPRWRGAAPVARAIEAGDTETGITLMQMDAGLDTGPMLAAERLPIASDDTTATLTAKLAALGARMIVDALVRGARGELRPRPQPAEGVTYARKLDKREAWLDWNESAQRLACRVRAFDPFPVACSALRGQVIRFWRAHAQSATEPGAAAPPRQARPGTVLAANADGVRIACGDGVLVVTELQRAGGKRLAAREFLAGMPIAAGEVFVKAEPAP
jgi:methionyl-tRNA formyltransferase